MTICRKCGVDYGIPGFGAPPQHNPVECEMFVSVTLKERERCAKIAEEVCDRECNGEGAAAAGEIMRKIRELT
jgi:transcription elongation GreA/GreB family factor